MTADPTRTPLLLTPGPLTTHSRTRSVMLKDWGSRDPAFVDMTRQLRERLLTVVNGAPTHVAIPLQGSGTFAVEATLASLIKPDDKLLILSNGAYGERMIDIARRLNRRFLALHWPEHLPIDLQQVDKAVALDPTISHVALVHCETTSGILNPFEQIASIVLGHGRGLILDAMSSFGALPIDLSKFPITAVVASSNKCLEGVPGIGFSIVDKSAIAAAKRDNIPSLSLDLYDQWRGFENNGQWRFTPPVQVVAALVEALRLLEEEGGPAERLKRYQRNFSTLRSGMEQLGFRMFLDAAVQAPIIATFLPLDDVDLRSDDLFVALHTRGFSIYPGKLTMRDSFRIGCIGAVVPSDFEALIDACREIVSLKRGRS
ncbi:2-aminoethylphosphonate--pyruvate transaminase [Bradyrhizobium centrolobii]|uniref:2-aminoethylphosphonate--pyruvate transaminase n=1 Tax=Bradyrhizobium centrolobii TaxID=1505087 RepID=A0A176Z9D7_9BRAD|nr:2-aminoethylphosphonate--pyruvate transaminase [Bradyrhizobium centrolobii]OAF16452.1 2-aminoethylphosphonate--pyruvate transaminase [Bradyrhizobium centrolobii]